MKKNLVEFVKNIGLNNIWVGSSITIGIIALFIGNHIFSKSNKNEPSNNSLSSNSLRDWFDRASLLGLFTSIMWIAEKSISRNFKLNSVGSWLDLAMAGGFLALSANLINKLSKGLNLEKISISKNSEAAIRMAGILSVVAATVGNVVYSGRKLMKSYSR